MASEAREAVSSRSKRYVPGTCELIDIPPRVERVLRSYMRQYPEDAAGVEKVLRFRKNVRKELDRLIGDLSKIRELEGLRQP